MKRRGWGSREIETLKYFIAEGMTDEQIAFELSRTPSAIKNMRHRLDVYQYHQEENPLPLTLILSQKEKEQRLYRLMERLAVRLG